jgi:hypothetical protein
MTKGKVILPLPPRKWFWFLGLVGIFIGAWTILVSIAAYLATSAINGTLLCGVDRRHMSKADIFCISLLSALLNMVIASLLVIKFKVGTFFTAEKKENDRWSYNKQATTVGVGVCCSMCHIMMAIFLGADIIPKCNPGGINVNALIMLLGIFLGTIVHPPLIVSITFYAERPWKRIKLPTP